MVGRSFGPRQVKGSRRPSSRTRRLLRKRSARFTQIDPFIEKAENCLATGQSVEACQSAELALQLVADHPRAVQILETARQNSEEYLWLFKQVEQACNNHRWFQATRLLNDYGINQADQKFAALALMAKLGRDAANRYAKLILWSLLGGAMLVLVGFLAKLFAAGVTESKTFAPSFWQTISFSAFFVIGSSTAILLLRKFLRRPIPMGQGHPRLRGQRKKGMQPATAAEKFSTRSPRTCRS